MKHRRRFRQRAAGAWGGFQERLVVTFLEMCLSTFPRGNPRRGFPLRKGPLGPFSNPFLRCRRRLRPQGRRPRTPTTFEKVDETFTFLHPTQARACEPAALRKPRRPKAPFATCPARPRAGHGLFLVLMILESSSIKLLISLNWRYTEANRT